MLSVLAIAHETKLVSGLERFSLKCINILDSTSRHPLEALDLQLRVANQRIVEDRGFRIRCEMDVNEFVSVLEIGATVSAGANDRSRSGILVSMDAIKSAKDSAFWPDLEQQVENAHLVLKALFFDVLSAATVESLGPVWSE